MKEMSGTHQFHRNQLHAADFRWAKDWYPEGNDLSEEDKALEVDAWAKHAELEAWVDEREARKVARKAFLAEHNE